MKKYQIMDKIVEEYNNFNSAFIWNLYELFIKIINKFWWQILFQKDSFIWFYCLWFVYYVYIYNNNLWDRIFCNHFEVFESLHKRDWTFYRISSKDREEIQKMIDDKRREKYITL